MTDQMKMRSGAPVTQAIPVTTPRWLRRVSVFAILTNTIVFVVVNYWIYTARFRFIDTHPAYVAKQPPTISRAISDNLIGDPFAFWIAVCAVLLALGVLPIGMLYRRASHASNGVSERVGAIVRILPPLVIASQFIAAIGMYMLSNFRFPDNGALHMIGSYLFFGFETLTVLLSSITCWHLGRNATVVSRLSTDFSIAPGMSAFRWKLGILVLMMAATYILLFVIKDMNLPIDGKAVYATYVLLEPAVISGFLIYLLSFNIDLARLVMGSRS
ncbi:MAG: hypothetical protein Q9M48_07425 [Rhodobacterales bacterium]|nr:hypothetical protein [Rhodobacterales bacterium]